MGRNKQLCCTLANSLLANPTGRNQSRISLKLIEFEISRGILVACHGEPYREQAAPQGHPFGKKIIYGTLISISSLPAPDPPPPCAVRCSPRRPHQRPLLLLLRALALQDPRGEAFSNNHLYSRPPLGHRCSKAALQLHEVDIHVSLGRMCVRCAPPCSPCAPFSSSCSSSPSAPGAHDPPCTMCAPFFTCWCSSSSSVNHLVELLLYPTILSGEFFL